MAETGRVGRRLHPRAWACLAIALAWLLFHAAMIFSSRVPYERDILVTVLPLRQYLLERLAKWQLPQWYPYEMMGVPFAGTLVASPFHPQVLLLLLLGAAQGVKWSILLGWLFGMSGAYRLAREWGGSRPASVTAACVFGLGGYSVSLCNNPPFLIPLMSAPWVFAAAHRLTRRRERRDIAALGVWWALVLLGGDAQLFLECGLISAAIVAIASPTREKWLWWGGAVALAAGLASVELLPLLATEDESVRSTWTATPDLLSIWAFHPLRLLDFVIPGFVPGDQRLEFGRVFEGQPDLFASSVYVGSVAAVLSVGGLLRATRGAFLWAAVCALGFALAAGYQGGLLELWWKIAPPFGKLRYPEKYIGLVSLGMVPLVAWGADGLAELPGWVARVGVVSGISVLVAAMFIPPITLVDWALQAIAVRKPPSPDLSAVLGVSWRDGLLRTGVGFVVLGSCLAYLKRPEYLASAVGLVVWLQLWRGHMMPVPLAAADAVADHGDFAPVLQRLTPPNEPPPRVVPSRAGTKDPKIAADDLVHEIHQWLMSDDAGRAHVDSFDPMSSAERARVIRLATGRGAPDSKSWFPLFNVCYRIADSKRPPSADEDPVTAAGDLTLVRNDCRPRAYLANAIRASGPDPARERLRGLAADTIVWEGGPEVKGAGGTVRWLGAEPEDLRLEVDAIAPSALFVSDAYAAGWTATVDGTEAVIHPADVAGRGVELPAGRHSVEMKYRAPGLLVGIVASVLALVAALVLAFGPPIKLNGAAAS